MLVIRFPKRSFSFSTVRPLVSIAALAAAGGLGACSADITRFDSPSFSLNGETASTSSVSKQPQKASRFDYAPASRSRAVAGYEQTRTTYDRTRDVQVAELADRTPRTVRDYDYSRPAANTYRPPAQAYQPPRQPRTVVVDYAPESDYDTPTRGAANSESAAGSEIVVRRGDTLYGLARRHGVSVNALKLANHLDGATIKPGQTLRLPGGSQAAAPSYQPATPAVPKSPPVAVAKASRDAPSDWDGRYTMARGDSLYNIARKYGVSSKELQRVNGIDNPRRVRPGLVLKVPGSTASDVTSMAAAETSRPSIVKSPAAHPSPVAVGGNSSIKQPTILNAKKKRVAALKQDKISDASGSVSGSAAGKLRWPVRGKIISGFGKRSDGTHNDGVNLEVPLGSDVRAAEAGVIAYAGSELKGYGNLILVRHDNGWVTAYAHNDKLVVKRGDKVTRGQVIAKAGKTGQVDRPQVHFELRQGSKPVDPVPYLERL